ncbi:MAG TPA: hypothetical protein PK685_00210 [archaeon]|jgi:adenylate kinase|nr:hypothetical protein [archaeon]
MIVTWSLHAQDRFIERVAKYNINYGDVEFEVKKQKVKIKEEDKIKTIFKIPPIFLTIIKKETKEYILILTLWESSEEEERLWKTK